MWDQGFHACDIGKGQAEDLYNVMEGGTRNGSLTQGKRLESSRWASLAFSLNLSVVFCRGDRGHSPDPRLFLV